MLASAVAMFLMPAITLLVTASDGWLADDDLYNVPCVMNVYAYVSCEFAFDPKEFITSTAHHIGYTYVPWPNQLLGDAHKQGASKTHCWTYHWGRAKNIYGAIAEGWARANIYSSDIPSP